MQASISLRLVHMGRRKLQANCDKYSFLYFDILEWLAQGRLGSMRRGITYL